VVRKKLTVLVVDDIADDRMMTRMILEKNNFLVEEASNFQEIIDELSKDKIDLVVLDVQMMDDDCKDILSKIKQYNLDKRYGLGKKKISVILYTSLQISHSALAEEYKSMGASCIVGKDQHPSILIDKVNEILGS
jgi:PleD family two-component response regulator